MGGSEGGDGGKWGDKGGEGRKEETVGSVVRMEEGKAAKGTH